MSSKTTTRPKSAGPTPSMNGKPTTNAWARPLQPKPIVNSNFAGPPPPGMGAPLILRERFLHLTLSMVGQRVVVHKTDGTTFEGIFHTFTPFNVPPFGAGHLKNRYVFKACRAVKGGDFDTGATLILQADQVSSVCCKSMRLDTKNGNARDEGFRTDVEISGSKDGKDRELVAAGSAWTSGAQKVNTGGLGRNNNQNNIGDWDQFKANEEQFGVRATFDESLYTTELDHSQVDARKRLEAQRLAKEIEGTASSNIHIAEERNQVVQGDYDEEDRYSGVLKSSSLLLQPRNAAAAKPETKATVPRKMNYAAAAAKADAKTPPGFKAAVVSPRKNEPKEEKKEEGTTTETSPPEESSAKEKTPTPATLTLVEEEAKKSTDIPTEEVEKADEPKSQGEKTPEEKTDENKEADENKEEKKPAPKLNPNAKSFSFNPSAKSFTPTFGVPPPAAPAPPVEYYYTVDPNTGAPLAVPGAPQMQGQPQFMPPYPGMGQPGMVPMQMGPAQFAAMRYPGFPYPGMEHQMPMQYPQQQPQHVQPQAPGSQDGASPVPPTSGDESETPQPPQPNQPVQVPYGGGPPGSYFPVGMMPRGPGFHPQAPPPHMGAPGGGQPYGHPMYAGPMNNMPHVRVPGGGNYYPHMGGMHYPPGGGYGGVMEDDQGFRGGGRGGRGARAMNRRNTKRSGRGGGSGRGFYAGSGGGGSGRQTPQSNSGSIDGGESKTSASPTEEPPQPSGEE